MKKLVLLFTVIFALVSCQKESQEIENIDSVDLITTILTQTAQPEFDDQNEGLYRGIFSTYDLSVKGEVILDLGNSKEYQAAVKLHIGGENLSFEGRQIEDIRIDRYVFESPRGSFEVQLDDKRKIVIRNFEFDGKDTYIVAYKERSMVDVSISFGNFTDDGDPLFTGNWDAINKGMTYQSPPAHSTNPVPLMIIEEIIISRNGDIALSTDTAPYNDSFLEPCFYLDTFQHGYFYKVPADPYQEIIAYNQTSTFLGSVCTWSLAHYFFGGAFVYDTPACGTPDATGYGSWSWNGRAGKIFVDRLGEI